MKRGLTASAALAAFIAACGAPPLPPAAEKQPEQAAADSEKSDEPLTQALAGLEAEVTGMDLYMHNAEPMEGRQKPALWVHAEKGRLEANSNWSLTGATAVIYRGQDEDIRVASSTGHFDETSRIARLEGGVKVEAGSIQFETKSVVYDNTKNTVEAPSEVSLINGATRLTAAQATLEPEEGAVILTDVSGTVSFAETLQ